MDGVTISKTMVFAIVTTIVSILSLVAGEEWIQAYPQVVGVIGLVVAGITAILRYLTSEEMVGLFTRKKKIK